MNVKGQTIVTPAVLPRTRTGLGRLGPREPLMRNDAVIMTVFLVLLFPLLLMVFALLMGRVEDRLQPATVTEDEVGEFLDQARPEEVNTLIREGWTGALARFRLRRRPRDRKVRKG